MTPFAPAAHLGEVSDEELREVLGKYVTWVARKAGIIDETITVTVGPPHVCGEVWLREGEPYPPRPTPDCCCIYRHTPAFWGVDRTKGDG